MIEMTRLPDEIRATLPDAIQAYIAFLEDQAVALQTQVELLQSQVMGLQAQVAEYQTQLHQHSGNSSRPPSSDPPDAPARPQRPPSGRRRGGQPGHQIHRRILLEATEVDEIVECCPSHCSNCQAELPASLPDVSEPLREQVWDLPPVKPVVTEYRYHTVSCPQCQTEVQAPRLPGVPAGAFGPLVTALVALLHGRYRLSAREIVALMLDVFHLPIGLGSIPELCRDVSIALATSYAEAQAAVSEGATANVDETGWKQAGQRRWLWVAVGAVCTVFVVATKRSAAVLNAMLGSAFKGIVSSDRFRAYLTVPVERRQICWAHLKRNLTAFWERDGPVGEWGSQSVALVDKVFGVWHQFREAKLDRAGLQAELQPMQEEMRSLLEAGCDLPLAKVQAFCRDLLALWPALWTFVTIEGVEPTNNAAERALRPAVLWRKGCFGAQSDAGNLFVARILTASATCRQQERHLLTFLTEAVLADRAGQPASRLGRTP